MSRARRTTLSAAILTLLISALTQGCLFTNQADPGATTPTPQDMGMGGADMSAPDDMDCKLPEDASARCEASCGAIMMMDSCGVSQMIECGECGEGQTCENNQCVCEDDAPAPTIACEEGLEGDTCGDMSVSNACGEEVSTQYCGCAQGLECGANDTCVLADPCQCDEYTCATPGKPECQSVCGYDACPGDAACSQESGMCEDPMCAPPAQEEVCGAGPDDSNFECLTVYRDGCEGVNETYSCTSNASETSSPLHCSEIKLTGGSDKAFGKAILFHKYAGIDGDVLFVGSPFGGESREGEVELFHISDKGEVLTRQVLEGKNLGLNEGKGRFGAALAVYGDRLIIGAPGVDRAFAVSIDTSGNGPSFMPTNALTDEIPNGGVESGALFGTSISADEARGRVAIGAPNSSNGDRLGNSGVVVLLGATSPRPSSWNPILLPSPEPATGVPLGKFNFGQSVLLTETSDALSPEPVLLVGAPGFGTTTSGERGAAFLYRYEGASDTWMKQSARFIPAQPSALGFGNALVKLGDHLLFGASASKRVYIARWQTSGTVSSWELETDPVVSGSARQVGYALAASEQVGVIGAPGSSTTRSVAKVYAINRATLPVFAHDIFPSLSNAQVDVELPSFSEALSVGSTFTAASDTDHTENGNKVGAVYLFPNP